MADRPDSDIELHQLQLRFARAAAELGVSCAVVTRSIQELERLLGVQLLRRTTRCPK